MPNRPKGLLKVGFNAALLSPSSDHRAAGMHRYIASLLGQLAEISDLAITAFVPAVPDARDLGQAYGLPDSIKLRPAPSRVAGPLGRIPWEQTSLPRRLKKDGAQILHGPAHAMPRFSGIPSVVTVHDLSFFRMPETLPRAKAAYLRAAMRDAAKRAAALIAVSQFTRDELVAVLGVSSDKIHVVPNGCDPAFRPIPADEIEGWRRAQGLPDRFILTVGTLQPRKNLGTLLEAYAGLHQAVPARNADGNPTPPALVIAGAAGWGDHDLGTRAESLGIAEHVHFPGFVPADDLPRLYNAATCLALPSMYEGFGLPVLEAMACGTPVLVSDASSLPEVAGDAGMRVPPMDVGAWAAALTAIIEDPQRQRQMRAAGLKRAEGLSWANAAARTAEVYREVAKDALGARSHASQPDRGSDSEPQARTESASTKRNHLGPHPTSQTAEAIDGRA
jgi:glycosyltransferase involved in cell wall biosynthesis